MSDRQLCGNLRAPVLTHGVGNRQTAALRFSRARRARLQTVCTPHIIFGQGSATQPQAGDARLGVVRLERDDVLLSTIDSFAAKGLAADRDLLALASGVDDCQTLDTQARSFGQTS